MKKINDEPEKPTQKKQQQQKKTNKIKIRQSCILSLSNSMLAFAFKNEKILNFQTV